MQVQVQFRGQHHLHHHHHGRKCWSPSFLKHSPPRLHLHLHGHGHGHGHVPCTPLRVQLGPQHQPPMPVPVMATSDHGLDINLINLHLHPELAVAEQDGTDIRGKENGLGHVMALGLMFASWNLFNIYFNILNKQVLKVYAFPMTVTAVQFGIGSVLVLLMWATNLHKPPNFSSLSHSNSRSQLQVIAALAAVHTVGNAFTNMSLLKVAVSFTHTVKAMEPFFSVLLSTLFLHQRPSWMAIAALVPIVGGVALASFTEASFNWIGFWSAMASNLANQSRNVVSKKLMTNNEESLDNINLFSLITLFSFIFSALLMVLTEGVTFTPNHLQASGLDVREIYVRSLLAGLCFHAYQQAGYMLLEHVSPVSHSVGNCVKRVVVIVSSVLFFRTPISSVNSLGTGIALAGVFFYSRVSKIKQKSL